MRRIIMTIGFVLAALAATTSLQASEIEITSNELFECSTMMVHFSDFPVTATAKGNWIAVAEQGSPRSVNTYRQKYLPIGDEGDITISTLGLIPFKPYELRAFNDWDATRSYEIQDSIEFMVFPKPGCEPAMLTRVAGTISQGEKLSFYFQGLQLNDSNWVTVASPNQVVWQHLKFTYLPVKKKGSHEIDTSALPPGAYQLRLFQDWKANKDYFLFSSVDFKIQ